MPHKTSAPELQLKVVQRNYESISRLMHGKQQECDKVCQPQLKDLFQQAISRFMQNSVSQLSLELEGTRSQLQDASSMHQQALTRASNAENEIKVTCCS